MTLSSALFRSNTKLQACAVDHQAHVTLGAVGEHVAKIQFALMTLDRLTIDRTELVAQKYGKSTAAAVLAYKSKRTIVNRSYQSAPDSIVGKMTIASLDAEMQKFERIPRSGSDCKPGVVAAALPPDAQQLSGGQANARLGFAINTSAASIATSPQQLGGVARIMVFFASNAQADGFPLAREIERARDCLFEHGVQLVVEKAIGSSTVFPFVERVLVNELAAGDNVNELRQRCENLLPGHPKVLRVIVCHMGNFEFGHTIRNRKVGAVTFEPFALLNTEQVDRSNATLIHEMVHCSKSGAVAHDPEANSVFFATGTTDPGRPERTTLRDEHARTIARSFFSIGGPSAP